MLKENKLFKHHFVKPVHNPFMLRAVAIKNKAPRKSGEFVCCFI